MPTGKGATDLTLPNINSNSRSSGYVVPLASRQPCSARPKPAGLEHSYRAPNHENLPGICFSFLQAQLWAWLKGVSVDAPRVSASRIEAGEAVVRLRTH